MATQLRHDGFARMTLYRSQHATTTGCAWCGQTRASKNGNRSLYSYQWVGDDKMTTPRFNGRLFCSVSCFETFGC